MKVLVINSSPRKEPLSVTKALLAPFVEGMREKNADVEYVNMQEKNIIPCRGCHGCMTVSPGKCVIEDEMTQDLFPKFFSADLVVLGSPVCFRTINGIMKIFIDRLVPCLDCIQQVIDGEFSEPYRWEIPKTIIFAAAGWSNDIAFNIISTYFKDIFGKSVIGEIYRGTSQAFTHCSLAKKKRLVILDALKKAGNEIIEKGEISQELISCISQPLGDKEMLANFHNLVMQTCMHKKLTLHQFIDGGSLLYPTSLKDFLNMMKMAFKEDAAKNVKLVSQFVFSGSISGRCYIAVDDGSIKTAEGTAPKPDITINVPYDLWIDILHGKANSQQMLMQKKYSVQGDFMCLIKMGTIFKSGE